MRQMKLIEPDRERAEQLAEEPWSTAASCCTATSTDIDLLVSEGLGEMDAFVAVTGDEESNLVTCLLAKHLGVRKTVALLSKRRLRAHQPGDRAGRGREPRSWPSRGRFMRFLRGRHVLSVATVLRAWTPRFWSSKAEPRVHPSPVRKPLRALKLPRGVLLGALLRPRGSGGDCHRRYAAAGGRPGRSCS
ncbi:MAG: hypothetical protein KatS3mg044_1032 [Rhodothermaceae bacterium]|nr:MAG: hypothetical protein KatS3mg044_1032 [Rhodothermaceae bacterium]